VVLLPDGSGCLAGVSQPAAVVRYDAGLFQKQGGGPVQREVPTVELLLVEMVFADVPHVVDIPAAEFV
jgi:hypothetical protein